MFGNISLLVQLLTREARPMFLISLLRISLCTMYFFR